MLRIITIAHKVYYYLQNSCSRVERHFAVCRATREQKKQPEFSSN